MLEIHINVKQLEEFKDFDKESNQEVEVKATI